MAKAPEAAPADTGANGEEILGQQVDTAYKLTVLVLENEKFPTVNKDLILNIYAQCLNVVRGRHPLGF